MTSSVSSLYRQTLRAFRRSSIHASRQDRSASVSLYLRQWFQEAAQRNSDASTDAPGTLRRQVDNMTTFLSSNRKYNELVKRYNSQWDLPDEERLRLTANRVGLQMPAEDPESRELPTGQTQAAAANLPVNDAASARSR
ncbi:uncharacterized protein L969DRAFT_74764 [Mixia osmundae IAM 14324]|uniref:ATP synthase assembly factor FMC1, mitochondrial n=1 Tax=Mixia osmundae (strain CBS 9802 / IAM 14324 / JCM 22182 / KY 12970) TaxID=764103 RepID=G7DVM1_MIXOS|nr:uncharacterized protein L969DRAFT_74764 [Mixia osmundae IAM 14324]KEI39525.1 hypothetical protein L969DRAFT_74764 [Mixia osmundae IAM 14324]GAA94631.1 hypothetical protein E5Q_01283 [Mixia osmundae IAM 14324]